MVEKAGPPGVGVADIKVTTEIDQGSRVSIFEFIYTNIQTCKLVEEVCFSPKHWKVYSLMDGWGKIWRLKDNWKEAGRVNLENRSFAHIIIVPPCAL